MSTQEPNRGLEPEAFFGLVTIEGKRCSSSGCGGEPVAGFPLRTPEEPAGVVWACAEHAAALKRNRVPVYEISRTCMVGGEVPCGGAATHMAIVGVRDEHGRAELRLLSVCTRHAEEGGA